MVLWSHSKTNMNIWYDAIGDGMVCMTDIFTARLSMQKVAPVIKSGESENYFQYELEMVSGITK